MQNISRLIRLKKDGGCKWLGGHSGKQRNSGRKKEKIFDLKQYKLEWIKNRRRIFSEKKYISIVACSKNTGQDMSVLVTAISRHICYLLNIGGKFLFPLPEYLTVKDHFCLYFCREIQDTAATTEFLTGSNRVKMCRAISLPHNSRLSFVGRRKVFNCRLVCGDFSDCNDIG